ncbi:MAG: hypothetical protein J6Q11_05130 [Fibrobacteraceae bacterium]|nr:hypothetical protein [Fibrobacteraceae bacterium]
MKRFFYLLTILSLIACTATTEPSQEFLESSSSTKNDSSYSSETIISSSSSEESLESSSSEVEEPVSSSSVENSSNSLSIYEAVKENEFYTTKDSVAAYLCRFGKLPKNYVNKAIAQTLYEETTGNTFSKWNFNPWKLLSIMVGGDTFSNREGLLPEASYKEADVEYFAENRGTKRLVYAENCVIYYTADHYESFSLLEIEK